MLGSQKQSITFIGAGNMASSLIGGLLADGYPADKITACDPNKDKLRYLAEHLGIQTTPSNREGITDAEIIVLAVKPNELKAVMTDLQDLLQAQNSLVVSIVAGILAKNLAKWSNCQNLKVVRCMPNTPALLRCGTTGLWANGQTSEKERGTAESILRAVGITLWLEQEKDLDTVTAISGSGPAYFFLLMECMLNIAKEMGLTENQAQLLTVNTSLGAAKMALESGKSVHDLRMQVTSKGGTTEAAINVLESGEIRELMNKALRAAREKAEEIAHLLA